MARVHSKGLTRGSYEDAARDEGRGAGHTSPLASSFRSPSGSRSPRRRRRSGSFDLSALVAKDKPAESRRDLAKRILVVSWDTTKPPPEDSELKCFFGFFDFVLATHVTPRRGLVLVASRASTPRNVWPPVENINIKDFGSECLGRKGAGTSPAVRHIRAATRESLSVRWGWEAAETPSPGSKSFAVPRTPRSSRQSTPDRYGEGERPYVVGGMLLADDAMSVSSASSVDEGPSVNRRVAFGTPVKKEAVVMREAPVAAAAAKHHHHSHKKEAPHPPSLTREAAVANEAPAASVSVKKHHHARKDATTTSKTPRKAQDAATSPSSEEGDGGRDQPAARAVNTCDGRARRPPSGTTPPSPSRWRATPYKRRRRPRRCGRARCAPRTCSRSPCAGRRRRPGARRRRRCDPGRPRSAAASTCGPAARGPRTCTSTTPTSRGRPAPRYAQMTLSQQRRRLASRDYRAFRESVCSQPPPQLAVRLETGRRGLPFKFTVVSEKAPSRRWRGGRACAC